MLPAFHRATPTKELVDIYHCVYEVRRKLWALHTAETCQQETTEADGARGEQGRNEESWEKRNEDGEDSGENSPREQTPKSQSQRKLGLERKVTKPVTGDRTGSYERRCKAVIRRCIFLILGVRAAISGKLTLQQVRRPCPDLCPSHQLEFLVYSLSSPTRSPPLGPHLFGE